MAQRRRPASASRRRHRLGGADGGGSKPSCADLRGPLRWPLGRHKPHNTAQEDGSACGRERPMCVPQPVSRAGTPHTAQEDGSGPYGLRSRAATFGDTFLAGMLACHDFPDPQPGSRGIAGLVICCVWVDTALCSSPRLCSFRRWVSSSIRRSAATFQASGGATSQEPRKLTVHLRCPDWVRTKLYHGCAQTSRGEQDSGSGASRLC